MIRLCIAGTSGHYESVLEAIDANPGRYELVGFIPSDASVDAVEHERLFGILPHFENYEEMLNEASPDIVVVCSYNHLHAEMAIKALERDINVYCEKPLTINLEDYYALEAAYKASKAKVGAMLECRFSPDFYSAYTAVKNGAVGKVRMLDARKSYKLGTRPWHYHKRKTYGSTICWVGIHLIDLLYWISGERFTDVFARHSALDNFGHGELESTATASFSMTGGVLASMTCDYYRPGGAPTHGDDRIRIVGTQGIIEVMNDKCTLIDLNGQRDLPCTSPHNCFEDFVRLTQNEPDIILSSEDSLYATKVALQVCSSADTESLVRF